MGNASQSIVFVSGSRADHGQISYLREAVDEVLIPPNHSSLVVIGELASDFSIQVTQSDVPPEVNTAYVVETLLASNNRAGIAKSIGYGIASLADYFSLKKPTKVVLFGDRFEMYSAGVAASLLDIETIHLHGGEVTGAKFDNFFRASLSLLADIHLVTTESHANNLLRLGVPRSTIQVVGAIGAETSQRFIPKTRREVEKKLEVELIEPVVVVAFHPEIPSEMSIDRQVDIVLRAVLTALPDLGTVIFSGSNSDDGGRLVSQRFSEFALEHENVTFVQSLGQEYFWSLLSVSDLLIGNSSAALIEAPTFGISIVDIGSRQSGRTRPNSVLWVPLNEIQIAEALLADRKLGRSRIADSVRNPYLGEDTMKKIVNAIVG